MRPLPALVLVTVSAFMAGCAGGGTGSSVYSEQQYVTAAGGLVQFRGGRLTVTVPANGVTSNRALTVRMPPTAPVPVDPNIIPDTTYEFGATTFASAATIGVGYDVSDLPNGVAESQLRIVRLTNGAWVAQSTTLDSANDRLTTTSTGLGVYAIRHL